MEKFSMTLFSITGYTITSSDCSKKLSNHCGDPAFKNPFITSLFSAVKNSLFIMNGNLHEAI